MGPGKARTSVAVSACCHHGLAITKQKMIIPLLHASFLQGFSGSAGGSSLFLPEGAVGVFDLPTTWAVVKSATSTDVPVIDTYVQDPAASTQRHLLSWL